MLKKGLSFIIEHGKTHHLNLIMIIMFGAFGVIQLSQNIAIGAIYNQSSNNAEAIHLNHVEHTAVLNMRTKALMSEMEKYDEDNKKALDVLNTQINSRIDIIDSGIAPEHKRRELVELVRKAIKENTTTKLSIRELNKIATAVIDYAYEYDLSIVKILAQIRQESNFKIKAKSRAGAKGLMQIMPHTMKYIEKNENKSLNAWNIHNNIRAGCSYMSEQLNNFGNYDDALRAYNWGPDNLRKYIVGERKTMPDETKLYTVYINKWIETFSKYGIE